MTEQKHLGLILDPKLKFAAHINEKFSKGRKGFGMIKHLKSYLPMEALISIYTTRLQALVMLEEIHGTHIAARNSSPLIAIHQ